jgi:hypothetical protein
MRSSPDKFCDGRTDGQTDGQTDDGEVIPICGHYSVEATQKCFLELTILINLHLSIIFMI